MNKKFFMITGLALVMLAGALGCAQHQQSKKLYYQEWDVTWLTPVGTELDIIGELYKPIKKATNKQIGVYVAEVDGYPTTIQYPILQKNIVGKWVVTYNGYDRDMMLAQYDMLSDRRTGVNN